MGSEVAGGWSVHTVDGAEVRLRSGRIGLVNVDATAPVTGGNLTVDDGRVRFSLQMALDQMRTGSFLIQVAARTLVSRHDAHVLTYDGHGVTSGSGWEVDGHAIAGSVDVELHLAITAVGPSSNPMAEIELIGSANLGTVHLPLPGLGTVEDFGFDVDARLAMLPHRE